MLTEKELQWLDNRRKFSCWYCPDIPKAMCTMGERPAHCAIMDTDLKEAAEFEQRVAVKMAKWDIEYHKGDRLCPYGDTDLDSYIPLCHCIDFCQGHPRLGCIAAKLAWIRMIVEEEMDNG